MSRAISPGMTAEVARLITLPGLLVEIAFQPVLRLSSRGAVTWSGRSWIPWHIKSSGLGIDGSVSSQQGTLTLGNTDLEIGVLVLEQGVADRAIKVWTFYGDAPGADDPVQAFGGVGDSASIDPSNGTCQIALRPAQGVTLYSPRKFMTKEQGWNFLPASGSAITWGRVTITLKAEGI